MKFKATNLYRLVGEDYKLLPPKKRVELEFRARKGFRSQADYQWLDRFLKENYDAKTYQKIKEKCQDPKTVRSVEKRVHKEFGGKKMHLAEKMQKQEVKES